MEPDPSHQHGIPNDREPMRFRHRGHRGDHDDCGGHGDWGHFVDEMGLDRYEP